ncbi:tetratricopeptide repeat protein [Pseudomonas saxonica]|nr:tetratricopeptide repeat protein [Pseudomonas saxonica]WRQ75534.1 tetratricopeptide repeat protein [Pseudomonas saxonica]
MQLFSVFMLFLLLITGIPVMAELRPFACTHEKDYLPSLDPLAEAWYQEAALLAKPDTLRPWDHIVELYSKAVERDHWKAMHNLAALYRTGWPGGVEKNTQKAIDLYQRMIDLNIPQGFYNMRAIIGNKAGVKNPATDGLTFLDKAARMGNPAALTELGKQLIYIGNKDELGLLYTQCAAEQGYGHANYELAAYYKIVKNNFPVAILYYQKALAQGHDGAAFLMKRIFNSKTKPQFAMWYEPNDDLNTIYNDLYQQLQNEPDLRFPTLMKDHPLPPHPTQGYDADRPGWKPEQ